MLKTLLARVKRLLRREPKTTRGQAALAEAMLIRLLRELPTAERSRIVEIATADLWWEWPEYFPNVATARATVLLVLARLERRRQQVVACTAARESS